MDQSMLDSLQLAFIVMLLGGGLIGAIYSVRRVLLRITELVNVERQKSFDEGLLRGRHLGAGDAYNDGWHAALKMIAHSARQPEGYRIAAAKIGKLCPACGKTCIHCAREGSSRTKDSSPVS